jgi:hypothetical protein
MKAFLLRKMGFCISHPHLNAAHLDSLRNAKAPLTARLSCFGGERGIRTLDTLASILPFQGSPINHSGISPNGGAKVRK